MAAAADDTEVDRIGKKIVGGFIAAVAGKIATSAANDSEIRNSRLRSKESMRLTSLGNLRFREGHTADAEHAWNEALELDGRNSFAANCLAWSLMSTARSVQQLLAALSYAERALRSAPNIQHEAVCLDTRGAIRFALGDYNHAISDYQDCLRMLRTGCPYPPLLYPGPETLGRLGRAFVAQGDNRSARTALRDAVQLSPGNVEVRMGLAAVLADLRDIDGAVQEYMIAIGVIRDSRNEFLQPDFLEGDIWDRIGNVWLSEHELCKAEESYNKSIEAFDGNPYPWMRLGIVEGRRQDISAMRRYLISALERADRNDSGFVDTLLREAASSPYGGDMLGLLQSHGMLDASAQRRVEEERKNTSSGAGEKAPTIAINRMEAREITLTSSQNPQFSVQTMHGGMFGQSPINLGSVDNKSSAISSMDLGALSGQLDALGSRLGELASAPEHRQAVLEIEAASRAARQANHSAVESHLKKAGQWACDVASQIGAKLALAAITSALQ